MECDTPWLCHGARFINSYTVPLPLPFTYAVPVSLYLGSLIVFDLLVHQSEGDLVPSSSTNVSESAHAVDTTVVTSVSEPAVNVHVSLNSTL